MEADEAHESTMKASQDSSIELGELEEIIGYKFANRDLLKEAFTHVSFADKLSEDSSSYDRLEYVGDAILNSLFTKEHYILYPRLSSGELTRLRAANVDTEKLARVTMRHGLHRFLRHNKPLLEEQKFMRDISDYPLHSHGLIEAPKALADIVESAIGAVYVDSNYSSDVVWKVFKGLLEPIISPDTITRHPVAELYEFCQKRSKKVKFVDRWAQNATFDVFVDNQLVGTGSYALKKEVAHCRAAKNALDNIKVQVNPNSK